MRRMEENAGRQTVLIVDDDRLFGDSLKLALADRGLLPVNLHSVADARKICSQTAFNIVLLDNHLPDGSGLELIPDILSLNDRAKIILITAFPSFNNAVKAIKDGAYDYISKPVDLDELHLTIERALRASNLEAVEQVARYRSDREKKESVLIGFENSFQDVHRLIERSATSTASVLITGETGTGKNVAAKAIHYQSERRGQPLISLNCAAIPESLIEAELFGVEKGAFTGASQTRKGVFELADGGTLFLDEIGEMPLSLQTKLLSVLEDRQIKRVGSEKTRAVDVRIIAATNANPEKAITEKLFRSDLFYRLSVIRLHLPALRERPADISGLCHHFIEKFAPNRRIEIPPSEIDKLQKYSFPGNVRELRNVIERTLLLQEGRTIFPSRLITLSDASEKSLMPEQQISFPPAETETDLPLAEIERQYILVAFDRHRNNLARTSKTLQISLSTLKRKLHEFGIR